MSGGLITAAESRVWVFEAARFACVKKKWLQCWIIEFTSQQWSVTSRGSFLRLPEKWGMSAEEGKGEGQEWSWWKIVIHHPLLPHSIGQWPTVHHHFAWGFMNTDVAYCEPQEPNCFLSPRKLNKSHFPTGISELTLFFSPLFLYKGWTPKLHLAPSPLSRTIECLLMS